MRFLVDAQLPPALPRWLAEEGHEAQHVADIGMASAPDRLIWRHALAENAVLLTKDEDFVILHALEPEGPCVVWLRIGNTTRQALLQRLATTLPIILAALASGERLIEVT